MGKFILNGVEYTSSSMNGFPPLIYSDEEREVGVWRDGKPLYQKIIVKNNIAIVPPNGYIAHEIQNVDMIIRLNVLTFSADSPTSYTSESGGLSLTGGSSTTIMNGFRADRTNIMFIGKSGSGEWSANPNRYWYFTLYYTKTTDTPGSGIWTTQGALAHHYSTDEHIIGTWIDGKPLYEKVFVFNQRTIIPEGSWFDTGFPTGNIEIVVFISGIDVQPVSGKGTAWQFLGADVSDTNIRIYQNRDLTKEIGLTHLIIRYTKTTD